MSKTVTIGSYQIGKGKPLGVIAGPCVIESKKLIFKTAEYLKKYCEELNIPLIFKSSFKKANRTSLDGFTGLPFDDALEILSKVRQQFDLPVLTDVHSELEVPVVAEVVDVLQIPAFLSRQTDLLLAAGRTGCVVNIKKGQFLAPEDMAKAVVKVKSTGNDKILLTERGTSFGYRNLVVDLRSLVIMDQIGYPVVYDATHSVQIPGGLGHASGGQPEYIIPLARAAIATGSVSVIFMEVHPDPSKALSDAASQLKLANFPAIIEDLLNIYEVTARH
jgi:2-dehydro-3-deoxyphosphooctonate aldolase (KDO 8-P synthase)